MLWYGLYPPTLEELGFTPSEMQDTFEKVIAFYFENLGCTLPRGHTWNELAHSIQGEINDPEELLSIVNEIVIKGTKSKHVFNGLEVLKDWSA